MRTKATVKQDKEDVIERPVLAKAIVEISKAFNKLVLSGFNERAIVCLIHDSSGVGKPDIRAVLSSMKSLQRDFCHYR